MLGSAHGLVRQLSTGPDGVAYAGVDQRLGQLVRIARLFLAHRDPRRWHTICHRAGLVPHLEHEIIVKAHAWEPEGDDPYLVTDLHEEALTSLVGRVDRDRCVHVISELAAALSEAHELGLAHGHLCPSKVLVSEDGEPRLDLFDLRVSEFRPDEHDRACLRGVGTCHPRVADVFSLGMICVTMLTSRAPSSTAGSLADDDAVTQVADAGTRLSILLHEMIAPSPEERPTMHEVAARLRRADVSQLFTVLSPGVEPSEPRPSAPEEESSPPSEGQRLGRYELGDALGEGGMGKVYRARDISSGEVVALKVLHAHWSEDDEALKRFYREAQLLSQLDNPHIARFIETNEVQGTHYLAMEFVEGNSLHAVLDEETRLDVDLALSITRDIALALADVHDLEIIHRDIKPANILLVGSGEARRAKLCDFGIARQTTSEQELTKAGLTVGTPHYMSPEQCVGAEVTPASDIYALGITLFKMLAGYVPFNAKEPQAIVYKHLAEPVPEISGIAPEADGGAARLMRRMLEKQPEDRIADARTLLEELEPIRTGDKTSIAAHPKLPEGAAHVITYDFEWELACSPVELWPHVSHTERLNRAIGLGAVEFSRRVDADGRVATEGHLKMSGLTLQWREHPYEWVAPTRMGVLREFSSGPFVWLRSSVELVPQGSGTRLRHQIQVQPRGMIGKAAAAMEVGYKARKNLEAVYHRIDELVRRQRATSTPDPVGAVADPFEESPSLPRAVAARIASMEEALLDHDVSNEVARRLCDHIRHAPPQEIARIRPRAFARRHELDYRDVLRACLHGAKVGLLVMLWDVICPRCRIPSNILETLEALRDHDHCDACNLDFELDFGRSVEIIFRAHPDLRDAELGTYCIGGPGHTPHVIMQIRLDPGERFEVDLMLEEGDYRVAGRHLPNTWGFAVERGAPLRQWELAITEGQAASSGGAATISSPSPPHTQRVIDAGRQRLVLCNDTDREVVARIEREGARADAVTAAEVAATAAFRELFPGEVVSPGHLISIGSVSLLLAEADVWSRSDDEASAFARLTELTRTVDACVQKSGGAVVKIHGDGVMAAFTSGAAATRAALELLGRNIEGVRVAVHTGPAMATSINERLDYFGRVVRHAEQLLHGIDPGSAAVSETTYADAEVADLLAQVPGPMGLLATQEIVGQVVSSAPEPEPPTQRPHASAPH